MGEVYMLNRIFCNYGRRLLLHMGKLGGVNLISNGAFRHVEAELYAYPDTKKEIETIRLNILHPYDEKPDDPTIVKGKNSVRIPGDPTSQTATLLATNRKLEQLERIADVISNTFDNLPAEKKRMMKLRYWTRPQT